MIYNTAVEQIKGAKTAQSEMLLPTLRLATVTSLSGGRAYIQFYGESSASSKLYPYLSGYKPEVGDKVLVFQQGSTYIIAGKITKDNVGDVYYLTKASADTLYAPIGTSTDTDKLVKGSYTLTLSQNGTLTPSANNTLSLGSSSRVFAAAYIDEIHGNLYGKWGYASTNYLAWTNGTTILPNNNNYVTVGSSSYKLTAVYAAKFIGALNYDASYGIDWVSLSGSAKGLCPANNATIDLGSSSSGKKYRNVYATQFYQNGTAISTSDRRKKTGIKGIGQKYIEFFRKLKPRLFRFKDGESGRLHSGFIAQEVEEAAAESGIPTKDLAFLCIDKDGNYGLRYEELIALQTKVIQDLMARVEVLEEKIKGGK